MKRRAKENFAFTKLCARLGYDSRRVLSLKPTRIFEENGKSSTIKFSFLFILHPQRRNSVDFLDFLLTFSSESLIILTEVVADLSVTPASKVRGATSFL